VLYKARIDCRQSRNDSIEGNLYRKKRSVRCEKEGTRSFRQINPETLQKTTSSAKRIRTNPFTQQLLFTKFVKEHKNVLKEKGIAEGGKLLGEQWRALSAEEKQKYKSPVSL
jgi:hypothetical protein